MLSVDSISFSERISSSITFKSYPSCYIQYNVYFGVKEGSLTNYVLLKHFNFLFDKLITLLVFKYILVGKIYKIIQSLSKNLIII